MTKVNDPLPEVPIYKRGQRLAEVARDFGLLFDAARTAADASKRKRAETAARIGRRIEREAQAMAELLETMAAAQPLPAPPPVKGYWNKEDGE